MNRTRTRTTLITTAVVAGGAGVLLLATPVLAANGPNGPTGRSGTRVAATATCPTDGTNSRHGGQWLDAVPGHATRQDPGGPGRSAPGMSGDPAANLPAGGTLTSDQLTTLAAMAEEDKLAHDVYVALAASTGDARFTRIAASESRHLDAIRVLLTRYGVQDPTAGTRDGQFATASVQSTYDRLVAQGRVSLEAALGVGRTIESADIADLGKAMSGLDAPDVTTVYQRLSAASQHHLDAFGG
jgi:hypothetical protein